MHTVVALVFVAILGSLAAAGVFMLRGNSKDPARGKRMAQALTVRITLSVLLFLFILLAWRMGWIAPAGLPLVPR